MQRIDDDTDIEEQLLSFLAKASVQEALNYEGSGSSFSRRARYLITLLAATKCSLWNLTPRRYEGRRWFTSSELEHVARRLKLKFDYARTAERIYSELQETGYAKVMKPFEGVRLYSITLEGERHAKKIMSAIEKGFKPLSATHHK